MGRRKKFTCSLHAMEKGNEQNPTEKRDPGYYLICRGFLRYVCLVGSTRGCERWKWWNDGPREHGMCQQV